MESFTTQDLIAELQEYNPPRAVRREGGLTVVDWAEAQNISTRQALVELDKLVDDGALVKEWSWIKKHSVGWVYYKK